MASPFGGSGKFVLIIGDEGAALFHVVGSRVGDSCLASSSETADSAQIADMLAQSPTTAIFPLIDVLEQSYSKETIPPVNLIDTARLVQRRLDTVYSNAEIKGSLYLGHDTGSERRDRRYLLAGLPGSLKLDGWIAWLDARGNPVKPLALLPLEAAPLARSLSRTFHGAGNPPSWTMLITRHRTGGFRQVVLHDGEFVFTRLTQDLPNHAAAHDVAATIKREHDQSMSYLRRMSLGDDQEMDIIVVGPADIGQALLDCGMPANRLRLLTPQDAAERLQLENVAGPGSRFADALHAAAFARRRRPIMSLLPQALCEKRAGAFVARTAYVAIALVIAILSFGLSDAYLQSQDIDQAYDHASIRTLQSKAKLGAAVDETDDFQVAAPEVADTIALYDRLSAQAPSPLPLLAMVGTALDPETVIHKIVWEAGGPTHEGETSLALTVRIDAAVGDTGEAVKIADAFATRLAERFPGLDVRVTDPPTGILPGQAMSGEIDSDDDAGEVGTSGYEAAISIILPAGWPTRPSS